MLFLRLTSALLPLAIVVAATAQHPAHRDVAGVTETARCAFTTFGSECGAQLDGVVLPGPSDQTLTARLDLSGAPPRALAGLLIGDVVPTPVTIAGSSCFMLVNAVSLVPGQTDGAGAAAWALPLRLSSFPLTNNFQAMVVSLGTAGLQISMSNGLSSMCR